VQFFHSLWGLGYAYKATELYRPTSHEFDIRQWEYMIVCLVNIVIRCDRHCNRRCSDCSVDCTMYSPSTQVTICRRRRTYVGAIGVEFPFCHWWLWQVWQGGSGLHISLLLPPWCFSL